MSVHRGAATRAVFVLVACVVATTLAACGNGGTRGSGKPVTVASDVAPFEAIDVSHAFDVTVKIGEPQSVEVKIDDNLEQYLDVHVSDDVLHIGVRRGTRIESATTTAEVTVPSLRAIRASGAAVVSVDDALETDEVDIAASGAAKIDTEVATERLDVDLSGAARLEVDGDATDVHAEISGAGELEAPDLRATDAMLELSGGSRASIYVTGSLTGSASGGSQVTYGGQAAPVDVDVSGGARISKS